MFSTTSLVGDVCADVVGDVQPHVPMFVVGSMELNKL